MRNWLRKWLGLDTLNDAQIAFKADLDITYTRVEHMQDGMYSTNLRLTELENILKPPFSVRLAQLKQGANLLTQFANELQRDIEKASPK